MRPCRLKARHVGKRACKAQEEQGRLANSEVGSAVKGPLQQGGDASWETLLPFNTAGVRKYQEPAPNACGGCGGY